MKFSADHDNRAPSVSRAEIPRSSILTIGLGQPLGEACHRDFRIVEARAPEDVLRVLHQEDVAVLVLGPRLTPVQAEGLLSRVRAECPDRTTLNVILEAGPDAAVFQGLVDEDRVFYLSRGPLTDGPLHALLHAAARRGEERQGSIRDAAETAAALSDSVLDFCVRLCAQADLAETGGLLAEGVRRLIGADIARCLIYDEDEDVLCLTERFETESPAESAASGLVGFVARTGERVVLDRVSADPRYDAEADAPGGRRDARFVAEPILGPRGSVIGVVAALRSHERPPFSEADLRVLGLLTSCAAAPLETILTQARLQSLLTARSSARGASSEIFRPEALSHHVTPSALAGELLATPPKWSSRAHWLGGGPSIVDAIRTALARWWRPAKRVPVVRQLAATDCGAACLAMVLGYFGKHVGLDDVRRTLRPGRDGSSAAAILRGGRFHGLRGRGVRAEIDALASLPPGAILFWEFRHFVVFERVTRAGVEIVDPASGYRLVPMAAFRRAFTGVALVFEPTEGFERAPAKPKRIGGLLKLVLERRDLLGRIVLLSAVVQILSAALPLLTGVLIDRVVPRRDYSLLLGLALGYCAFQVFGTVAGFMRAQMFIRLRTQLESRFTLRFLDHLVELPYSYFQQHTAGDLMVRLGSNSGVRDILTSALLSSVMDGTMASIYLVMLLLANRPLTLIVLVLAAARFGLLAAMRRRQRQYLAESLENDARSRTEQVEMLSGMEVLKAMGLEGRAAEAWSNVFVDGLNISIRRASLDAVFTALLNALGVINSLALMFYGTFLVLDGSLSLGTMMAIAALAAGFLAPLNNLVSSALQLQMLEIYVERINDVLETPPEQDRNAVTVAAPLTGAIALEDVSFRYTTESPLVLEHMSIVVKPGSRVALVGRTSSGKSTLARLLAGLYEPSGGRVLFDGSDLTTLDRRSVRSQLGIVTQETQLFGGSIRRNIALSDPEMALDRVVQAARLACVHDEIQSMPMGYETPLTDRGLSLSGGQRQRLAIARALAGRPRILVLDEATSHLDAVTEERINENLAALGCTRIVIAHRLSTVRDADSILVLESGRLVEQGSHAELSRAGGFYARLLAAQRGQDESSRPPA